MHAVPASLKGKYVIRFTVTSQRTTVQDVARDWELISDTATELEGGEVKHTPKRIPLKRKQHKGGIYLPSLELDTDGYRSVICLTEIKEQNPQFGTSLLMSHIGTNSAETPKIVNGSFAALFETDEMAQEFSKRLQDLGIDAAKETGMNKISFLSFDELRILLRHKQALNKIGQGKD